MCFGSGPMALCSFRFTFWSTACRVPTRSSGLPVQLSITSQGGTVTHFQHHGASVDQNVPVLIRTCKHLSLLGIFLHTSLNSPHKSTHKMAYNYTPKWWTDTHIIKPMAGCSGMPWPLVHPLWLDTMAVPWIWEEKHDILRWTFAPHTVPVPLQWWFGHRISTGSKEQYPTPPHPNPTSQQGHRFPRMQDSPGFILTGKNNCSASGVGS